MLDPNKVFVFVILLNFAFANIELNSKRNNAVNSIYNYDNTKRIPQKHYNPSWDDLDTRPLPTWYDNAKIGIFMHWGVYSVPSYGSEWFWANWENANSSVAKFMREHYPPNFSYQDFASMFTAEFFNPNEWADLFEKSGARYVVLTSKHHEGFTLFPSKRSFGWNAVDTGPHRDLVKDVSQAIRNKGLKFGVYHSLYEWYNPIYIQDKKSNFTTTEFVDHKLWPDIKQLINDYEPSVLWADGDWEADDVYWKSTDLLAWLYNESPVKDEIVVNDRWGRGIGCHHGDFYNCEDRYSPGVLQNHKWENAFTVDRTSWGYRRNMHIEDILTNDQLLLEIVTAVSCGGNALINIGPTKEGTIVPIFQERLLALGEWLNINGEAIYETKHWLSQNDTYNGNVWYTCKRDSDSFIDPGLIEDESAIYAISLTWPKDNELALKDITPYLHRGVYGAKLLGNEDSEITWNISSGITKLQLPEKSQVRSKNAYTIKFHKI